MIGIPIALFVANGVEWYLHKHVLHGIPQQGGGRKSLSAAFMKRHWSHHRRVRLTQYRDDELYADFKHSIDAKAEAKALVQICAVTSLALPIAPFFTLTTYYCAWNYYHVHSQSHLSPEWGKKKIPWHYDHHMNTNQDANWCVTKPWFDYIMGTRVISSSDLQESNPLGIKLPAMIEKPLNALARKYAPRAFEKLDANAREEARKRAQGLEEKMPDFTQVQAIEMSNC